jgi:hypothetical protein
MKIEDVSKAVELRREIESLEERMKGVESRRIHSINFSGEHNYIDPEFGDGEKDVVKMMVMACLSKKLKQCEKELEAL